MKGDDRDDNDKSKMTQRRPTQVPSDGKDMNNFSSSLDEAAAAAAREIQVATKGATKVSTRGRDVVEPPPSMTSCMRPYCFVGPGLRSQTKGDD